MCLLLGMSHMLCFLDMTLLFCMLLVLKCHSLVIAFSPKRNIKYICFLYFMLSIICLSKIKVSFMCVISLFASGICMTHVYNMNPKVHAYNPCKYTHIIHTRMYI